MKKQLFAAAFLASAALPTIASDFYVIADLGQSELDVNHVGGVHSKDETTFSLGGGYKLNNIFALEVVYRDFGGFSSGWNLDHGNGDYRRYSGDTSVAASQASVVAQLPLNDAFALYGRLGAGYLKSKTDYESDTVRHNFIRSGSGSKSDSKTKVVFGVGFKYALTQSFAVRAEYNQYDEWDDATISSATIGLTYQF